MRYRWYLQTFNICDYVARLDGGLVRGKGVILNVAGDRRP